MLYVAAETAIFAMRIGIEIVPHDDYFFILSLPV